MGNLDNIYLPTFGPSKYPTEKKSHFQQTASSYQRSKQETVLNTSYKARHRKLILQAHNFLPSDVKELHIQ